MASFREMHETAHDRARFVVLAKKCLLLMSDADLDDPKTEKNRKFLTDIIFGNKLMDGKPETLSIRQAEWLFGIWEDLNRSNTLSNGASVAVVLINVYGLKDELNDDGDDSDYEWIVGLCKRNPRPDRLSGANARRLERLAEQVGAFEFDSRPYTPLFPAYAYENPAEFLNKKVSPKPYIWPQLSPEENDKIAGGLKDLRDQLARQNEEVKTAEQIADAQRAADLEAKREEALARHRERVKAEA